MWLQQIIRETGRRAGLGLTGLRVMLRVVQGPPGKQVGDEAADRQLRGGEGGDGVGGGGEARADGGIDKAPLHKGPVLLVELIVLLRQNTIRSLHGYEVV